MQIKKKFIRSIDRYISHLSPGDSIRIVVEAEVAHNLSSIGFSSSPVDGETVLPAACGKVSEFNADGEYLARRDLPKEYRYVTTVEWTWEQWDGYDQTKTVTEERDIYRDCYQREFLPPPSEELTWIKSDGSPLIISLEFSVENISKDSFKHLINLFLELFGECEIRRSDLSSFTPSNVSRVNWHFLPPGRYPWDRVLSHTRNLVRNRDPRYSKVILGRQHFITKYQPDEIFVGNGGFRAYVAYVFKEKETVILESVLTDNATYVFGKDWEDVAILTKAEVLSGELHKERIIHSKGWRNRIDKLLKQP